MALFDELYQQQKQSLGGLVGGLAQEEPLGAMLGGGSLSQLIVSMQAPTIKFTRHGQYGVKEHLSFIDNLRLEIDSWLKL